MHQQDDTVAGPPSDQPRPDQPSPGPPPPPPGHPAPPYGYPPYGYWYPPKPPTNGLAIASLVVSCSSVFVACLFYGIPGLLGSVGAILGHVARKQVRERGEQGDGLALAGIIVGWIITGIAVLAILVIGGLIWYAVTHQPPDDY